MPEFRMPALGADMDEGTVTEWRVKPGDRVHRGDIVAVVETQKATLEVEIFQDGVVDQVVVQPGVKVPVGTVLATLRDGATAAAAPAPAATPAVPAAPEPAAAPVAAPVAVQAAPGARQKVSPLARRTAAQLGISLEGVAGTGPSGSVVEADVRHAAPAAGAPAPPPAAAPGTPGREQSMREAIAKLMARSKREIPHYYLATDIDMSPALRWLERENERRAVADRLIPAALLLRAVALAVDEVPEMNGFFVDGAFHASEAVHLGVAISLRQGGLIAPALHDVDSRPLDDVMKGLLDLVARTRAQTLRASEMSDSTLTVTNLGDRGVETVYGVIYPPQVALVGFGRITERPWASGGMVGARPVLTATLAADHRVSDGHRGGLFLAAIARLLQEPEKL